MKRFIILLSTFCLLVSSCISATGKKEWKQPKPKQGQTIQEAFDELRQNRNTKIEKRKDSKRFEKASRSQAVKNRKEQKKQEKKARRVRASESEIDRLDPRKPEFNDLMDLSHENILLDPSKRS